MLLDTSGVPYDVYYLRDILTHPELQNYKVYIFLHDTFLSDADREEINRKLKTGGRTLVWVGDTGYISEKGKSAEARSRLVGMNVRTEEVYDRLTSVLLPSSNPTTKDVPPFQGMGEMFL